MGRVQIMQNLRAIYIELYNYRFYFLNTLVYVLIIDKKMRMHLYGETFIRADKELAISIS